MTSKPQFSIGALGGTFDHFHKGHEHFLKFAAEQAQQLLIGVTNQSLVREKELSSIIEPYEVRTAAVRSFCEREHIQYEIVELTDPYGPTLGQHPVDCLIVTELTERGGEALNQKRAELNLAPLPVFVSTMLRDDSGQILNSTRIRKGEVSREGEVYTRLFKQDLILNEAQRQFFKKPLGEIVIKPRAQAELISVVGDYCLNQFLEQGWQYNLGVYDLLTERQAITFEKVKALVPDETCVNKPGQITANSVAILQTLLLSLEKLGHSHAKHLTVNGEEDLLAAALVLLLPLNAVVYYGQPGEGMVEVVVSEELKDGIYSLFLTDK